MGEPAKSARAERPALKLYEITDAIREILAEAEDTGELSDEQVARLDALEMAFERKVENCLLLIQETLARATAYKAEAKRLSDRAHVQENMASRLKAYVKDQMGLQRVSKFQGDLIGARIQKNPPSVNVILEHEVPKTYWVQPPPELDRKGILAALKAGETVPGAELAQGTHLRIM